MTGILIKIEADEIEALAKLSHAESKFIAQSHINNGYSQAEAYRLAYGTVIDSIINRAASNSPNIYGGTSILNVITHNNGNTSGGNPVYQYTPLAETGGSWEDLSFDPLSSSSELIALHPWWQLCVPDYKI